MARDYNNQGIYVIENMINGKKYIGQSIDLDRRWKQHYNYTKNMYDYPLYRAFRKYGIENFEFRDLEYVENFENLTKKEMFWYKKIKPEYNQISPIESNVEKKAVYQIDLYTLKILNEYKSGLEASKVVGVATANISNVCNRKAGQTGGYYWCFIEDYNDNWKPIIVSTLHYPRPINKIKDGFVLVTYPSIMEASRQEKICHSVIARTCNRKNKYTHGFEWKFVDGGENNSERL